MMSGNIPQEMIINISEYFSDTEFMENICLLFRSPIINNRREKINKSHMRQSLTKYLHEVDDILYDTYYISTPNMLKDALSDVVECIFDNRIHKRLKPTNHLKQIQYKKIAKFQLFRPLWWTMTRPVEILENINLCPVYRTTQFKRRFLMRQHKTVAALIY